MLLVLNAEELTCFNCNAKQACELLYISAPTHVMKNKNEL